MIRSHLVSLVFAALSVLAVPAFAAIDVNRASQAELETVKGIGPGLSGKILAAREKGAFRDWTDLQERVSGIGAGNSAKFSQAGLTVAGSGFQKAAIDAAERKSAPKAEPKARAARAAKAPQE